ncbi:MAG: alpha/beta hydrolase [Alphaproteobacteria bacterium]|nr:alpha/beta hydrolase [Alphaproteobacteria bacterium]
MATMLDNETRADARAQVRVEDVEYQRQGDRVLLARLYRPVGTGPFPAVIQVHGGAWVHKDRTDNDFMAMALAESGILVASLDFRMPPEAPYPASLADINLGIRWLKARARTYGSRPDWVGLMGTSSGGHQVLLAAMRPENPRYTVLSQAEGPQTDARVAFVISGWGVLDPLLRYHLAKKAGNDELLEHHHAFWGDEATMSEGSIPAILDRGEKVFLPPALVFGGDVDEWVPLETMRRTVDGWKKGGGKVELELYKGANHGFMTGKPNAPYARPALERMKQFIRAHTG